MGRTKFDDGSGTPNGQNFTIDNPGQWGGSTGTFTNHTNPQDGTHYATPVSTPEQSDVNRYKGIGQGMQGRDAYKLQFGDANTDHAQGLTSGESQGDANDQWQKQATGQDMQAYNYGQGLLQRGAQNQEASALSTAGGALGGMSALRGQKAGQAAYMQRGTNDLNAQHADDMAAGRTGLSQGLAAQRGLDQQGQYLSDQQTELQAQSEDAQRKLNDAGQYGMDQLGINTEAAALGGRQHAQATATSLKNAQTAADDASTNRSIGLMSTGLSAIPVVGSGMSAVGQSQQVTHKPDQDPSDERVKTKLPPSALTRLVAQAHEMQSGIEAQREMLKNGPSVGEASRTEDTAAPAPVAPKNPEPSMQSKTAPFSSKPKPLLASVAGPNASESLPSDDIEANYRLANGGGAAGTAPAMTGYDRSMYSRQDDGTVPNTDALHAGIEASIENDKPAGKKDPLAGRAYEAGAQQGPKGYHESRRGAVGDVLGGGPKASYDLGFGDSGDKGMAPGTHDALKYGGSEMDGSTNRKGLAAADKRMDDYSKAVSTSDARAKQRAEVEHYVKEDETETGNVMSGDRTQHNPSAFRPAASSTASGGGYARQEKQETPEQRTQRFLAKSKASSSASISDERAKDTERGAPDGSETVDSTATTRVHNPLVEMQKDANRKLAGETYRYKEGVGEDTNQVHHGFMAQNLEQNPITALAVREDETGIKKVDNTDALRVTAAGVASLQDQHDELADAVAALGERRGKKRSA